MRDWILQHKGELDVYVTLHSFGQFWLRPWGYTYTPPDDSEVLVCVAVQKSIGEKS